LESDKIHGPRWVRFRSCLRLPGRPVTYRKGACLVHGLYGDDFKQEALPEIRRSSSAKRVECARSEVKVQITQAIAAEARDLDDREESPVEITRMGIRERSVKPNHVIQAFRLNAFEFGQPTTSIAQSTVRRD